MSSTNGTGYRSLTLPTWCPECQDSEVRSLVKINGVMCQTLDVLKELERDVDKIELQELPDIIRELASLLEELKDIYSEIHDIARSILTDLHEMSDDLHTIISDLRQVTDDLKQLTEELVEHLNTVNNTLLGGFAGIIAAIGACCAGLQDAIKNTDLVRATSGAFCKRYTLFSGATNLFQIDCFSIADELRWVFVFDGTDTGTFPLYIAPICPQMSTSFDTPSPFQNGVTVGMSKFPTYYEEETDDRMLVTATRRG